MGCIIVFTVQNITVCLLVPFEFVYLTHKVGLAYLCDPFKLLTHFVENKPTPRIYITVS